MSGLRLLRHLHLVTGLLPVPDKQHNFEGNSVIHLQHTVDRRFSPCCGVHSEVVGAFLPYDFMDTGVQYLRRASKYLRSSLRKYFRSLLVTTVFALRQTRGGERGGLPGNIVQKKGVYLAIAEVPHLDGAIVGTGEQPPF